MHEDIFQKNRACLHSVENWIAPEDYRRSRDDYGCPPHALPLLNLPIDVINNIGLSRPSFT